ncbi:hypothetical protein PR003_g20143 [Phytophthora rubi]|uniref:Uncharacterized protein n=1 Tax=Phytophthora rubi TaxID=129364 RepID=A0A6A4DPS8_9STRA|nr:hypothetical protein PR002_g19625 [Phytophthora rubi]KAE9310951.1 hypothetical protein PR003_g20143 [Phytophthora rubi]
MRSAVKVQWGTSARLVLAGSREAKLVQVLEGCTIGAGNGFGGGFNRL